MRVLIIGWLLALSINSNAQEDSTTKVQMIPIPDSFAIRMQGVQVGVNIFSAVQGVDSVWYVSPNAITDFADNFQYLRNAGWVSDTVEKYLYEFNGR